MLLLEMLEGRRLLTVGAASADALATPLAFEPNLGQTDRGVDFLARGTGYGLFLSDAGQATLSLRDGKIESAARAAVLRMRPVGGNPDAVARGERMLPGRVNSFVGDRANWRSDIPTFAAVRSVHALTGHDVLGGREQLGLPLVTARPQLLGGLLLGHPGWDVLAEDAREDQVGGLPEDPRTQRHQPDADDREHHDQDGLGPLRRQPPHQPLR